MHGALYIWTLASGELRQITAHDNVIWKIAFTRDGASVATASWDGTVKLWDVATGAEQKRFTVPGEQLHRVAISDRVLAVGTGKGTVVLFDLASGHALGALAGAHSSAVLALAFDGAGERLSVGSEDHAISLWDVASRKIERRFDAHDGPVTDIAFMSDGKRLLSVSYDPTLKLWDAAAGILVQSWHRHDSGVVGVEERDGRAYTAGFGDKSIIAWDLSKADVVAVKSGHQVLVQAAAFSRDGRVAISGSDDHAIKTWDVASGVELSTIEAHKDVIYAMDVSPDGKVLATGGFDRAIKLWDTASGKHMRDLLGHEDAIYELVFDATGSRLASISADKTLRIWETAAGSTLRKHALDGAPVALAAAGNSLVLTTMQGSHFFLPTWEAAPVRRHGGGWGVVFAPDGGSYFIGGSNGRYDQLALKGETLRTVMLPLPTAVKGSSAGERIGFGLDEGAMLWSPARDAEPMRLIGHRGQVNDLVLSRDGKRAHRRERRHLAAVERRRRTTTLARPGFPAVVT